MICYCKGFDNEYVYFDEKQNKWKIKDEAPDELKKEFHEFMDQLSCENDGVITHS